MKPSDKAPHKLEFIPLPFCYYSIPFFLITLTGIGASIYLSASHYRIHTDPYYSSFCAVSRALNCDTVSSSRYAVFLNIPMAIWGVIGYAIVLAVLMLAIRQGKQKTRYWPVLFWVSLAYSLGSLILAGISSFLIHSYCIMCIVTYIVNLALLYYAWFVNRRFGDAGLFQGMIQDIKRLWVLRKITVPAIGILFIIVGGLMAWLPPYWQMTPPVMSESVGSGITEEGYPWIGAAHPTLTIQEFSDYMCFQCKKMHFFLRELIRLYPDQIRLIHRHFPMDHTYNPLVTEPFHSGSGKMALIALYSQEKGQFWKINDYLFNLAAKKTDFNTQSLAKEMGISSGELAAALNNKYLRLRLKHDIAMGIEQGIDGTPGFLIDCQVYVGSIPPEILRKFVK